MVEMEKNKISSDYRRLLDEVRESKSRDYPETLIRRMVNPLYLHILKDHIHPGPNEVIFWNPYFPETISNTIEVTDEVAEKLQHLAGPYRVMVFRVLNEQLKKEDFK